MEDMKKMIETVRNASKAELIALIERGPDPSLLEAADAVRRRYYGERVFFRGLVEFSNYCKNGCYYCGLQRENRDVHRYRLTPDEILACCREGRRRGFHSFVLQSGEDAYYNEGASPLIVDVVARIKREMPECALTLSVGELPSAVYEKLHVAGGDRFLLRHETADAEHYARLHPPELTFASRKRCLYDLKAAGFAVGAGFMVGSPGQTTEHLAEDLLFLKELQPEMVGIGPFIPQAQTCFADAPAGSLERTLSMIALVRLLLPTSMLPSTTALGTLGAGGRERGLRAGANVVMPNLTPLERRKDYMLYDGKIGVDDGVGEGLARMIESVRRAGYEPDFSRGDPVIL